MTEVKTLRKEGPAPAVSPTLLSKKPPSGWVGFYGGSRLEPIARNLSFSISPFFGRQWLSKTFANCLKNHYKTDSNSSKPFSPEIPSLQFPHGYALAIWCLDALQESRVCIDSGQICRSNLGQSTSNNFPRYFICLQVSYRDDYGRGSACICNLPPLASTPQGIKFHITCFAYQTQLQQTSGDASLGV